ncbi:hypothetical protein [Streptomyces sp. NBC_01320]|uniref:hypothetical protein n=1 Tax=Streptomyces sp. NBC_01320 TaxID=2903824 RepID=UPI002E0E9B05|nr:hypothetical protein OG395_10440 [Streptomyces sp. NBC_01320]
MLPRQHPTPDSRAAGTITPADDMEIYHLPVLTPLILGGPVIAVAGAMLPAGWAARTATATPSAYRIAASGRNRHA